MKFSLTKYKLLYNFNTAYRQTPILDTPQKYLLSSVLKERPNQQTVKKIQTEIQIPVATTNQGLMKFQGRQDNYIISQEQYKSQIESSPHGFLSEIILQFLGKVHIFKYLDTQFTLIGTQYHQLPLKNVYKLLINTQPDLILLQVRPDQILENFKTFVSKKSDPNTFSSNLYFDQITRSHDEINPSQKIRKSIIKKLGEDNIIFNNLEMSKKDSFDPYELYERVSSQVVGLCCLYSEINNHIPIVLGDLPETIFRDNIVNPLTLRQLQQIFDESVLQCAQNPDIQPNTPMNLSFFKHPQIFLQGSDSYLTTVVEYIAALKKYKRVIAFLGHGQSDSVSHLLDHKTCSHFETELTRPLIKQSILKETTQIYTNNNYILSCEDLVEKHALLDIMHYGLDMGGRKEMIKICLIFLFQILLLLEYSLNYPEIC